MTRTPRLQRATERVRGPCSQSLLRSFLHDERNQGLGTTECRKARDETRKRQGRFAISSSIGQLSDFRSKILAGRGFQTAQEMENPRSAQETLQHSLSALS